MAGRKIQPRDSKGRFRKADYEGDLFIHVDHKRVQIKGGNSILLDRKPRSDKPEDLDDWLRRRNYQEQHKYYREARKAQLELQLSNDLRNIDAPTKSIYLSSDDVHKSWREKLKEFEAKNEAKKLHIDEYNPKIEREAYLKATNKEFLAYDEKQHRGIIALFREANKKIAQIEEDFGIQLGKGFHLYPSDNLDRLQKKIDKALEITDDEYLDKLAATYKFDFISNFANHVEGEDFEEFVAAVTALDDLTFLKTLQKYKIDYLAYALDSILTNEKYEGILESVRVVTQISKLAKEGKV